MIIKKITAAALVLQALFCSISLAQEKPLTDAERKHLHTLYSFEDGKMPDFIKFKHPETASFTTKYSQDKEKSIEWKPGPDDSFRVEIGNIGNPFGASGASNYNRSAFRFAIRSHDKGGVVKIKFKDKNEKDIAQVFVPMVYDGWQNLIYHYSSYPKFDRYAGKTALKSITHMVVETSDDYPKGEPVYLDSLKLNYHVEWRQFIEKRDPKKFYKRIDILKNFDDPRIKGLDKSILAPPTKEELAGLELIKKRSLGNGAWRGGWTTMKQVENYRKHLKNKYGLHRNKFGIARGHAKWHITITDEMRTVARCYVATAPAEVREGTEDLFILLTDLLYEMGARLNGPYYMNNYIGRPRSDAVMLMHNVLRKHGRLKDVVRKMEQDYGYNRIFDVPSSQFNMDHFHNEVRYRILIALLQDTVHEQVIHLRILSKVISQQILADGVLQVDGSLYHHGMNYYSYGGLGLAGLGRVVDKFNGTPFQISKAAFEKYTNCVMMMRWYSNALSMPLTLHGRSPGSFSLSSKYLNNVVSNSAYFNDGKTDPKLANALLRQLDVERVFTQRRFDREKNAKKKSNLKKSLDSQNKKIAGLEAKGFKAEAAPQGNRTMPYAGTSMHRRGEWLAHVRGFGSGLKAFETYGASGRFNLFIANGYLDIYSSGEPVSAYASGYRPGEGWDWRYLDGTTSILMPYEKMSFGKNIGADGSSQHLIGGLSHRGWNGVFSMPLYSSQQQKKAMKEGGKPGSFEAKKSYFFFDDRIVCLGSGVKLNDSDYEVITTLFQKSLSGKDDQKITTIDGEKVSSFDYKKEPSASSSHWLIDPYDTGYFVPQGQSIKVVHSRQKSRTGNDGAATEGNYAKAYLSHGTNPSDGAYSYIAFVKTDAEKMKAFSEAMQNAETAPVQIVAQDKDKHIVFDRQTSSWGAVFHKEQPVDQTLDGKKLPLQSVAQACLVMVEHEHQDDPSKILLSLTDPGIRTKEKAITANLAEGWELSADQQAELPKGFTVENGKITLPIIHGRSHTIAFENPALKKALEAKKKEAAEKEKAAQEAKEKSSKSGSFFNLQTLLGGGIILILLGAIFLKKSKSN